MNEQKSQPNESHLEDRMTKKDLKELKVTTYTNKVHLPFRFLNNRNLMVKRALLRTTLCWRCRCQIQISNPDPNLGHELIQMV